MVSLALQRVNISVNTPCTQYTAEDTVRAEAALLTVWAVLQDFREDLVLVGGLVPRYICLPSDRDLPPVTISRSQADERWGLGGLFTARQLRVDIFGSPATT